MEHLSPSKRQGTEEQGMASTSLSSAKDEDVADETGEGYHQEYLAGWRLHIMTFASVLPIHPLEIPSTEYPHSLFLSLFIATLEVSIVSTSLVTITDSLQDFGDSSWIVIAYLLTYTGMSIQQSHAIFAFLNTTAGFLIIWAKISDVLSRKLMICLAVLVFLVFSGACGAAQSLTQLCVKTPCPLRPIVVNHAHCV